MPHDYYALLALPRDATPEQIRARFLQLAREEHPDRFHGAEKTRAEARFQAITEAFNVLSNPERRRLHDQDLLQPAAGSRGSDPTQLARVYLQRGAKAFKEKKYLEAAESFDRATRHDPKSAQAWHYLALACSQQGRWLSRATKAIAQACELEPMNGDYLKLAGRLFAEAGMRLRAEKYYQRALQWGGEDAQVRRALQDLQKKG